jgi:hypothetical protein
MTRDPAECEQTFVTSRGSAYARFQRALKSGNLTIIRNAAGDLPHVELADALTVRVAIHQAEPERFDVTTSTASQHQRPLPAIARPPGRSGLQRDRGHAKQPTTERPPTRNADTTLNSAHRRAHPQPHEESRLEGAILAGSVKPALIVDRCARCSARARSDARLAFKPPRRTHPVDPALWRSSRRSCPDCSSVALPLSRNADMVPPRRALGA